MGFLRPREAELRGPKHDENMKTNTQTLIHLEDVEKVFLTNEVETHALVDINLEIQRGEYVCIAGP